MSIIDDNADDYMEVSGLEFWKDLKYYGGKCQVSSLGRLRIINNGIKIMIDDDVKKIIEQKLSIIIHNEVLHIKEIQCQ